MKIFEYLLQLALEIVKIIREKGDAAANVRLKDLKGFLRVKKYIDRESAAVDRFLKKYRAR